MLRFLLLLHVLFSLLSLALSLSPDQCGSTSYCKAALAHQALSGVPPGFTRSVVHHSHYTLLTPDSRVYSSPPPGWTGPCSSAALITPAIGAHFSMYLLDASAGTALQYPVTYDNAPDNLERLIYVLTGEIKVINTSTTAENTLDDAVIIQPGGYIYIAPNETALRLEVGTATHSILIDRVYAASGSPDSIIGHESAVEDEDIPGEVFRLRRLLPPRDPNYDFNIHIMDFQPGEYLVVKEVHYNQHGLILLQGEGLYMLGERFFPVSTGDVIYMAPFVPQWYAALGKQRSRYWLYKDTHVNPLCHTSSPSCKS